MGIAEEQALMQRHRLTVDEYYRMAEAGVLAPDARVELIEGEIVDMAPMKSRHAGIVNMLDALLHDAVAGRAIVRCQLPLRLGSRSEPEPDLLVAKPRADFYTGAHPTASDVLLLIEVSDTTSRYDRQVKAPLYAQHGVPEVWLIDLDEGVVRFLRQPDAGNYADISNTKTPGKVALPRIDGATIDLASLLP